MKKYIATFLSLILIANLMAIPAGAISSPDEGQQTKVESTSKQVIMETNADGTYTLVDSSPQEQQMSMQSTIRDEKLISAVKEMDTDILRLTNGQYLIQAYENTYVPAEKIVLDTKNFDENAEIYDRYDIPQEDVQFIKEAIASQMELGNSKFEYNIYVTEPFSVPEGNNTLSSSTTSSNVKETVQEVRNYISPYRDIVTGTTAKSVAQSVANLVVSVSGLASPGISIFGVGMTALTEYQNQFNKTITVGYASDYQQVCFKYDWLKKTSSVVTASHGNQVGCISQKLWIDYMEYRQYFLQVGKLHTKSKTINKVYMTPSWENSQSIALYNWTSPVIDKNITTKFGSKTFTFGGSL